MPTADGQEKMPPPGLGGGVRLTGGGHTQLRGAANGASHAVAGFAVELGDVVLFAAVLLDLRHDLGFSASANLPRTILAGVGAAEANVAAARVRRIVASLSGAAIVGRHDFSSGIFATNAIMSHIQSRLGGIRKLLRET